MRENRAFPLDFNDRTREEMCCDLLVCRPSPHRLPIGRDGRTRRSVETKLRLRRGLCGSSVRDEKAMTVHPPDGPSHVPVMLGEVMRLLSPKPGETFVDGTVGTGGHAQAMMHAVGNTGRLLVVDRDPTMLERARTRLDETIARFVAGNFSELDAYLREFEPAGADGVFLDLGVASPHLDDPARGFSYRMDGPLDMRMTQAHGPDHQGPDAEAWINSAPEAELARVIREYGEERFAGRIARRIVEARKQARIRRTLALSEIIRRAVPRTRRRLHPARRTFQALRIFINRELDHLDRFLQILPRALKPRGRSAVISYHSLEDRRVKHAFREGVKKGYYEALTRKPLRPSPDEVGANPRSRSARLRAIRKRE